MCFSQIAPDTPLLFFYITFTSLLLTSLTDIRKNYPNIFITLAPPVFAFQITPDILPLFNITFSPPFF